MRKSIITSAGLGAALLAAVSVTGCSLFDKGFDAAKDESAKRIADAYAAYCALPVPYRQRLYPLIQAEVDRQGLGRTVPVLDCDFDGEPDFDPDGIPAEGG